MGPTEINIIASQLVGGQDPGKWERQIIERPIPTATVQDRLNDFIGQIQTMLPVNCAPLGQFQLEEVSVTAQIDADGVFKLVGTDSSQVSGGMRFTLKRKHDMETADLKWLLIGTEPVKVTSENKLRANLTTLPSDPPVQVRVDGIVPVAEQNLPLPVIDVDG